MIDEVFNDILKDVCNEDITEIVNHVVFIMDHSGSMNCENRNTMALNNFNEQIQELKKQSKDTNQKTLVTLVEFAVNHVVKYFDRPIDLDVEQHEYRCYGSTALNDTIAIIIGKIKEDIPELSDKSKNHSVLFIIMTDGEENASTEFGGTKGRNALKLMIEDMEKEDNWTFTFMGSNLDVQKDIVDGMAFGAGNTMSFTSDSKGFSSASSSTSSGISHYYTSRSMGEKKVDDFYGSSGGDAGDNEKTNEDKWQQALGPHKIDTTAGNSNDNQN